MKSSNDRILFWDKQAPSYAKEPISDMDAYEVTQERIKTLLKPHHRVLELGCGTGSTALELAPHSAHYLATDISPGMIEIAKSKRSDAQLTFTVQEAAEIEGTYDVILALNLLHLVEDIESLLTQIYNALPAEGLLIAKTGLIKEGPFFLPLLIPFLRFIGKAPYVRNLSSTEFHALLQNAGFEVTETLMQSGMAPRVFTVARKPQ